MAFLHALKKGAGDKDRDKSKGKHAFKVRPARGCALPRLPRAPHHAWWCHDVVVVMTRVMARIYRVACALCA